MSPEPVVVGILYPAEWYGPRDEFDAEVAALAALDPRVDVVVAALGDSTLIERAGGIAGLPAGATDLIEEVDIVLRDGDSLAEACLARRPQGYDFLVGSHSLEHVPDLLGFFQEADRLLAPGAVITQALPDLRFCFDFFRPRMACPRRPIATPIAGASPPPYSRRCCST